jgi:hypothetical protein
MLRFKIVKHQDQLIISQTWFSLFIIVIAQLIIVAVSLLVLLLPRHLLDGYNEYAFLIYFVPIIPILHLIHKVFQFIKYRSYLFDKREDALKNGNKILAQLSFIKRVDLVFEGDFERQKVYLRLVIEAAENLRLKLPNTTLKNTKKLGLAIAKFLSIEFINTHPHYDTIIWGGVNASEKDISFLENKLS